MKLGLSLLVFSTLQAAAFAGNPNQETITCRNEHYSLVLRETAVPTYKTATLSFSGRHMTLKCQGEFQQNNVSFTCEEDRAGDGRYLAGVVLVGEKGSAEIAHEQMYPLAPKHLADLTCELNQG
ncbi:MAG: hypothetical protein EBQ92_02950 [Proteobacteria bacterium]|nr:hypothetical protein [Pseudomonadota bacterium]